MRMEPIERPRNLLTRLGYWMSRRQLGKVPTAFKVTYARAPRLALVAQRILRAQEKLSLDRELVHLLMSHSSR